jgi:hypothetical protein
MSFDENAKSVLEFKALLIAAGGEKRSEGAKLERVSRIVNNIQPISVGV